MPFIISSVVIDCILLAVVALYYIYLQSPTLLLIPACRETSHVPVLSVRFCKFAQNCTTNPSSSPQFKQWGFTWYLVHLNKHLCRIRHLSTFHLSLQVFVMFLHLSILNNAYSCTYFILWGRYFISFSWHIITLESVRFREDDNLCRKSYPPIPQWR